MKKLTKDNIKNLMSVLLALSLFIPVLILAGCGCTTESDEGEEVIIPQYTITVSPAITGGTIETSISKSNAGRTIFLTITPDDGYQLKEGTLRFNSTVITGTSFKMPDEDIIITAEFEEMPTFQVGWYYGSFIEETDEDNGLYLYLDLFLHFNSDTVDIRLIESSAGESENRVLLTEDDMLVLPYVFSDDTVTINLEEDRDLVLTIIDGIASCEWTFYDESGEVIDNCEIELEFMGVENAEITMEADYLGEVGTVTFLDNENILIDFGGEGWTNSYYIFGNVLFINDGEESCLVGFINGDSAVLDRQIFPFDTPLFKYEIWNLSFTKSE